MTIIPILIMAFLVFWAGFKYTNYHWTLTFLFGYCLLYASGVAFAFNHHPAIQMFSAPFDVYSMLGASHVAGSLILVRLFAAYAKPLYLWYWGPVAFFTFLTLDAVGMFFGYQKLMTGGTFDTAIMAMCMPLLFLSYPKASRENKVLLPIFAATWGVAIFLYGGSTAYFILIAQALTYAVRNKHAGFMAGALILTLAGYLTQGAAFVKSDGRLLMWAQYIDWWTANANIWIGTGPGSFQWIGPMLKLSHTGYNFFWMHNDFLQFLFEYGITGFALLSMAYAKQLHRARNSPAALSLWVGVGVCMFFYSPLHVLPVAVFIALLLVRSYGNA